MKKGIFVKALLLAFVALLAFVPETVSAKAKKAKNDAQNGDWSSQKAILFDTSEADLMVRVGDIDCLNSTDEEFLKNYNPFKKISYSHEYPWNMNKKDAAGTDRMYVGTKATKNDNSTDGYSSCFREWQEYKESEYACAKDALKLTFSFKKEVKKVKVKSAALQICIDDFQAMSFNSKFTVKINGKNAQFLADAINRQNQTGPIAHIITVNIPSSFLKYIKKGKVTITIDETTGIGDGYAIDFAKLLINPKTEMVSKAISLKSLKAEDECLVATITPDKKVTGYEVRYSAKSSMADAEYYEEWDPEAKEIRLYSLESGKKYYVQVRSFMDYDGSREFSEWTEIKSATVNNY